VVSVVQVESVGQVDLVVQADSAEVLQVVIAQDQQFQPQFNKVMIPMEAISTKLLKKIIYLDPDKIREKC